MTATPPTLFDDRYEPLSKKGVAGGYAGLDEAGIVSVVHLPEATTETLGLIKLAGGTAESPIVTEALSASTATTATAVSGIDFGDFELVSTKNAANGYAGLNSVSRTTKGVDTTDDVIVDASAKGIVLKDTDGHYWRAAISTLGVVTWSDLGTTKP